MKILKTIICVFLSLMAVMLPPASVIAVMLSTPAQYQSTFYGALDDKFDRLCEIEEEKIVVVGGSSVAFGLDSALLEEYTGKPCVNFGLYAALGTRLMLDLSRAGINKGDTVILAPELDEQTLSMYFSSEHTLQALEGNYKMARYVRTDAALSLIGGLWKHTSEKLSHYKNGTTPDPEGVYRADSFNEYGDIAWDRAENAMPLYYDPNGKINLTPEIFASDFVDYLNEYIRYCEYRGATVYFSFCPMNALAVQGADSASELEDYIRDNINCELISRIDDYVMEAGYFYDTNFHLNDAGVTVRTLKLAEDIRIASGDFRVIDVEYPEAPELPMADVRYFGEDDNAKYFTYEQMPNGAMMIVGISELGMGEKTLTIPLGYDGYKVSAIGARAFEGGAVSKVVITEDTSLRNLLDGAFDSSSVTDLWIYYDFTDENEKLAPCTDFGGLTLHVAPASQYTTHYDWQNTVGRVIVTDIEN